VLRQVGPDSCPGRLNFHCHTTCSDGSLAPELLAQQALLIGLEHLAITDHHTLAAHERIAAALERHRQAGAAVPTLWRGVEISCLLEGCLVHVLGLGFSDDHGPLEPYLQGAAAVGLALLAHPARYRLPHTRLIAAAAEIGLDGAEAFYDYTMGSAWQATPLVCEAIAADLGQRGLLLSCGTDTHGLALQGR
jgi:predicted metal-dependent phosphoesterase TrpH